MLVTLRVCEFLAHSVGIDVLLKAVDDKLSESHKVYHIELDVADGKP